jgi:hypothetical protein
MDLKTDHAGVVNSLSATIQQKLITPAEQRFQEAEKRIRKLEYRLTLFTAGLAVTSGLALALAVLALTK